MKTNASRHARMSLLGIVSPRTVGEISGELMLACVKADQKNGMSPPFVILCSFGLTDVEARSFNDYAAESSRRKRVHFMTQPGYLIEKPCGTFIAFFYARDWIEACFDYEVEGYEIVITGRNSRRLEVRS